VHNRRRTGYKTVVEFDQPLRVALVNECELVRVGVSTMMAEHSDRVVVLPNRDLAATEADLALIDPFARRGGVVGSAEVARPPGGSRVVVYTWETRSGFVERAMLAGAHGYLSKALPATELVAALEKVHLGERLVAVDEPRTRHERRSTIEVGLTPRETDVIGLIAAGVPNKEISRRLELSMNTVKSHIRTAYRSMGVTSRTQAVLWAVEHGVTATHLDMVDRAS
jgi:NarL family two-component system response regulator LiaR